MKYYFFLIAFIISFISFSQPNTDVFLFDLSQKDGSFQLSNGKNISENEGYDCFITNMLPSFYHKMLSRGAREAGDNEDAVKIMKSTRLC